MIPTIDMEILNYRGVIDEILLDKLASTLEQESLHERLGTTIWKKVCNIAYELMSNINKHTVTEASFPVPFIEITSHDDYIGFLAGNALLKEDQYVLSTQLDVLNTLDISEIKQLFINKASHAEITDKGGAGLGLLTIYKSLKGKITYEIQTLTNNVSYITIKIKLKK